MVARASPREIDPADPRAHVTAFPTITVSLLPGTLKGQNSSAIIELIVKYMNFKKRLWTVAHYYAIILLNRYTGMTDLHLLCHSMIWWHRRVYFDRQGG